MFWGRGSMFWDFGGSLAGFLQGPRRKSLAPLPLRFAWIFERYSKVYHKLRFVALGNFKLDLETAMTLT